MAAIAMLGNLLGCGDGNYHYKDYNQQRNTIHLPVQTL